MLFFVFLNFKILITTTTKLFQVYLNFKGENKTISNGQIINKYSLHCCCNFVFSCNNKKKRKRRSEKCQQNIFFSNAITFLSFSFFLLVILLFRLCTNREVYHFSFLFLFYLCFVVPTFIYLFKENRSLICPFFVCKIVSLVLSNFSTAAKLFLPIAYSFCIVCTPLPATAD